MQLQAIRIQNFQSLVDASISGLEAFNVFVGKNNSGKSSIFRALDVLAARVDGRNPPTDNILSECDTTRRARIELTFALGDLERVKLISLVCSDGWKGQSDAFLKGAFGRRIKYCFENYDRPDSRFSLCAASVMGTGGQWMECIKRVDVNTVETCIFKEINKFTPVEALAHLSSISELPKGRMALTTDLNRYGRGNYCGEADPIAAVIDFLKGSYFLNPFRHAHKNQPVRGCQILTQDGANLITVLHDLQTRDDAQWNQLKDFVEGALPRVGKLQTPMPKDQQSCNAEFRQLNRQFSVPLQDMGSGVEQLLMIATVLATTDSESPIFLEEPESHLHASAQRYLVERLAAAKRPIFITTHSPVVLNAAFPKAIYRVAMEDGKTKVSKVDGIDAMGQVAADLGIRNSDVLLQDAVVFFEGPTDCDCFSAWTQALGFKPKTENVAFLMLEGADHFKLKSRITTNVLDGLTKRTPVPHLFVLDRDERSDDEVEKLETQFKDRIHILRRRELENYLLSPKSIVAVIIEKLRSANASAEQIADVSVPMVTLEIECAIDTLKPEVLIRRIRNRVAKLDGGLFPRELRDRIDLTKKPNELAALIHSTVLDRVRSHMDSVATADAVTEEAARLETEWTNANRKYAIVPGSEVLEAVFTHFGTQFNKRTDSVSIARLMTNSEIEPELIPIMGRIAKLAESSP